MLLEWSGDGKKKEKKEETERVGRVVSNKSHDRRLCYRGHKYKKKEEKKKKFSKSRPSFESWRSPCLLTYTDIRSTTNRTLPPPAFPLHQLPGDTFKHKPSTFHSIFLFSSLTTKRDIKASYKLDPSISQEKDGFRIV